MFQAYMSHHRDKHPRAWADACARPVLAVHLLAYVARSSIMLCIALPKIVLPIPINVHTNVTIAQLRAAVAGWRRELRGMDPDVLGDVLDKDTDFYVIEVNLPAVEGTDGDAAGLHGIPTGLRLAPEEIESLKAYGKAGLRENAEWQRLLRDFSRD